MMENGTTISISLSRKINIGNYESVDLFLSLNGLSVDATDDDMEALLDTGDRAYEFLRRKVVEKTNEIKGRA